MANTTKPTKKLGPQEFDGLLEEYKTLREEILSAKGRRLQTVSLTVGAFGAMLSIIAGAVLGSDVLSDKQLAIAVGGGIALYGLVIPSQIMTTHLQQTIQRIGGYIRVVIEPRVPGLSWENRWEAHKSDHKLPKGLGGISGIYYFLALLPPLLPLYVAAQRAQDWLLILVLLPFLVWSFGLSYDMRAGKSRGWKWQWESIEESMPIKKSQPNTGSSGRAGLRPPEGTQPENRSSPSGKSRPAARR
jgi:hypothetical protein